MINDIVIKHLCPKCGDSYYIEKIRKDLEFIVNHMRNVDIEENRHEVVV